MTNNLVCKTKGAAFAVLDAIADILPRGTQREALLAVKNWIGESVNDDLLPEETRERIKMIFEGSEWEQKGKAWLDREMSDPGYPESGGTIASDGVHHRIKHKMIHEPEDGAELDCFWCDEAKRWEPIGYGWPSFSRMQEYIDTEDKNEKEG